MFLPNRRFIIGDEEFFFNSQPSVISAALVGTVSVCVPHTLCQSLLWDRDGHLSQLTPWAGAAQWQWWHPCPLPHQLPHRMANTPQLQLGCAHILGEEWAGEERSSRHGSMSRGNLGAGLIPPETHRRGEMQEEWHVILDCSLQACWLCMCKNNN